MKNVKGSAPPLITINMETKAGYGKVDGFGFSVVQQPAAKEPYSMYVAKSSG